jgi:hypothetical protein
MTMHAMEEMLTGEPFLPVQYAAMFRRRARSSGEMLAVAVLEQAIGDIRLYRGARRSRERRLYRDAHAWIDSNDRSHTFSFVNICEVLGLSPGALRAALLRGRRPEVSPRLTAAA